MKVGDLVIRGEADAPTQQTVSIVTEIDGETAKVLYIARRLRKQCRATLLKPNPWPISQLVPVSDFGVTWVLKLNDAKEPYLDFQQAGDSWATYKDGTHREWQPSHYACVLDRKLHTLVVRLMEPQICPACHGAGSWETECCAGWNGCSCKGERVQMGQCLDCSGTGTVTETHNSGANRRSIQGLCFIGSGPQ